MVWAVGRVPLPELDDTHRDSNRSYKRLEEYYNKLDPLIKDVFVRPRKPYKHEASVFGDNSYEGVKVGIPAHKHRQDKMKEGEIAQLVIGQWSGWVDLQIGHSSGLDCRKSDNSAIIELKNKHNTCNSGSEKAIKDKLAKYKNENPETECIWGIVNPKPGVQGLTQTLTHDGVELIKMQGDDLFSYVFTHDGYNYSNEIIEHVKTIIKKELL